MAKIALITFNDANKSRNLSTLVSVDRRPEKPIIAVDRLAIETKHMGRLRGCQVHRKRPYYFSLLIGR